MQVVSNKKEIIFRNEYEGKPIYKIGISHKNQDGTYTSSTMLCRLPKDTELHHKTWISIKNAWLDFYLKEVERNGKKYNEAVPYIFISDFDILDDDKEESNSVDPYEEFGKRVEVKTEDLPF